MRDLSRLTIALVTGGLLLATPAAAAGRAGVLHAIEESADDPEVGLPLPGPPRGIAGHGVGAERLALPAGVEPAAGGAPADAGEALNSVRISGAVMAGDAVAFALSPGGLRAVYIADQETPGIFELYSTPVNGSAAPVKISAGLPFGAGDQGVRLFQITPDGNWVVFLADANSGSGSDDVYSVPILGGVTPKRLNVTTQAPVTGLGILDNTRVAYFGNVSGVVELFRATIDVVGAPTMLSNVGTGSANGDVVAALFSPGGTRVLYAADRGADNVFQWWSVASSASGPGQAVQLSAALGSVNLGAFTPNGATVVYTADENLLAVPEIYSIPATGGTRARLNPSMVGDGVRALRVGPDGTRVAYIADQHTANVPELYTAEIGVAGSGTRLNAPLSGMQGVRSVAVSPGGQVVYESDENAAGTVSVMGVPLAGGTRITLHGVTAPDDATIFSGLGTPIVGPRVVYPVTGSQTNLFSATVGVAGAFIRVDDPLPAGETILNAYVPFVATRLLAFGTGPAASGVTTKAWAAPIRSDLAPVQFNATAGGGALGVLGFQLTANEDYAVYLQDQTTAGKVELWSRALDSDGDSIDNVADNCEFVANPTQNDLLFTQPVTASSKTTFGWAMTADVRYVRGGLSGVSSYMTNQSGSLVEATSLVDPTMPGPAAGLYYLFAVDCPGGSWQSSIGAEPGRDAALP